MNMRALAYTAPSTLEFRDAPLPVPRPGQVLIRPAFTGICGTDLTIWHDRHPRATPVVVLGHEFSGTVISAPDESGLRAGDPVVVEPVFTCGSCRECRNGDYNDCAQMGLLGVDTNGSMSSAVAVDLDKVIPVPAAVSLRDAAFVEPLAVVAHAFRRASLDLDGETVFISGGGPIGLLAGSVALAEGARVLVSEPNTYRREAAERLGLATVDPAAETVSDAMTRHFGGQDVALAIEASGVPAGLAACVETCRPLGTVVFVGLAKAHAQIDGNAVIGKELRLLGSRIYTRIDFERALELLEWKVIDPADHISDVVPLSRIVADGFERIDRGDPVLKIMIDHAAEARAE